MDSANTPSFWQSEDMSYVYTEDDGDYKWISLLSPDKQPPGISETSGWIPAKVLSSDQRLAVVQTVRGEKFEVDASAIGDAIPSLAGLNRLPDDLIHLDSISEQSVVYTLTQRFQKNIIYTAIGGILIAINPFQLLPLYTPLVMQSYLDEEVTYLPPHPYAISRKAYTNLLNENTNQAILISGESGAGKTETTKLCLSFLSEIAGSPLGIEQKILSANPILEAFGNAKTLRNHNSSRFGKFMELSFDVGSYSSEGSIIGCGTVNYLLEKSRVHKQGIGERSYHIFYQLCRAATSTTTPTSIRHTRVSLLDADAAELRCKKVDLSKLHLRSPEKFHYLSQSNCLDIAGVDDVSKFNEMESAAMKLGLSKIELTDLFSVCAVVLHLGNIKFKSAGEGSTIDLNESSKSGLELSAQLLGVDVDELTQKLTTRELKLRGEVNMVQRSASQASDARDALAKALYMNAFDWLVMRLNEAMRVESTTNRLSGGGYANSGNEVKKIGILDIFGFEIFDVNGFEQLCINYANEKLQQHFNRHTFKNELEACQRENIPFEMIEFTDNQDVLDLIEAKGGQGILSILDDEIMVPRATDVTLLNKLVDRVGGNNGSQRFSIPKGKSSRDSFAINHYAGCVIYRVQDFLEKNRDNVDENLDTLWKNSYLSFQPAKTAEEIEAAAAAENSRSRKAKQSTLGSQFKKQLDELISKLNQSTPHFIRCIKPNNVKKEGFLDGVIVHQQLKQSGCYDALTILKRGYPFQYPQLVFYHRYKPIVKQFLAKEHLDNPKDLRGACKAIVNALALLPKLSEASKNIQVGSTMVFWKSDEDRQMSSLRTIELGKQATIIKTVYRSIYTRRQVALLRAQVPSLVQIIADIKESFDQPESVDSETANIERIQAEINKISNIKVTSKYHMQLKSLLELSMKRLETHQRLITVGPHPPKTIDDYWLNIAQMTMKLELKSSLANSVIEIYKQYIGGGAETLAKIQTMLQQDELTLSELDDMIQQIVYTRKIVREFAFQEEKTCREYIDSLRNEPVWLAGVADFVSQQQVSKVTDGADVVAYIAKHAKVSKKLSKNGRAILQVADFLVGVREAFVRGIILGVEEGVPLFPPPPPPKRATRRGTRSSLVTSPSPVPSDLFVDYDKFLEQISEVENLVSEAKPTGVADMMAMATAEITQYTKVIENYRTTAKKIALSMNSIDSNIIASTMKTIESFDVCYKDATVLLLQLEHAKPYVTALSQPLFGQQYTMLQKRSQDLAVEAECVAAVEVALVEGNLNDNLPPAQFYSTLHSLDSYNMPTTTALQTAIMHMKQQCTVLLLPNSNDALVVAEYILQLRNAVISIYQMYQSATSTDDLFASSPARFEALNEIISRSADELGMLSNTENIVSELDYVRSMILSYQIEYSKDEKFVEFKRNFQLAFEKEDEAQLQFLIQQFRGLDVSDEDKLRSTYQEVEALVSSADEISVRIKQARAILEKAMIAPLRVADLKQALSDAKALNVKLPVLYKEVEDTLNLAKQCSRRLHLSWYGIDAKEMVAAVEQCAANNVIDDEIPFVKMLIAEYNDDPVSFYRLLLKLNTFLERQSTIDAISFQLNKLYFKNSAAAQQQQQKAASPVEKSTRRPFVVKQQSSTSNGVTPPVQPKRKTLVKQFSYANEDESKNVVASAPVATIPVKADPFCVPSDSYHYTNFPQFRKFADPVEQMDRKRFTSNPISTSLLRIANRNQVTLAVAAFQSVLGYMGEKYAPYPPMLQREFLEIACKAPCLTDECYCQLMKQLTHNPSKASRSKGVELFKALAGVVPPSVELEPYVEHFLRDVEEFEILSTIQGNAHKRNIHESANDPVGDGKVGWLCVEKGRIMQLYARRWFVLTDSSLLFFQDNVNCNKELGRIEISQTKDIRSCPSADNDKKKLYPFEIEMKNGAVQMLYAASPDDRDHWLRCLRASRYRYWVKGKNSAGQFKARLMAQMSKTIPEEDEEDDA